ncbi:MAG: hypothetical protein U0Q15_17960 [Kineosporiaceae bacterium]
MADTDDLQARAGGRPTARPTPAALVPVRVRFDPSAPPGGDGGNAGGWWWRGGTDPERPAAPGLTLSGPDDGGEVLLWPDGSFAVEWEETAPEPVVLRGRRRPRPLRRGGCGHRVIDRLWPDESLVVWLGSGWRVA